MLGNLPLFLEHDELFDNDVVSYTFGDQEALYLRGQWTLHRNEPRISSVWIANPSPNPSPSPHPNPNQAHRVATEHMTQAEVAMLYITQALGDIAEIERR